MNESLQLQLLPKAEAPRLIGTITAAGARGPVPRLWRPRHRLVGGLALLPELFLVVGLASVGAHHRRHGLLRPLRGHGAAAQDHRPAHRYWLYYVLTFMTGARRQLFLTFGGFLLVMKFGYCVADMAMLMLITTPPTRRWRRGSGGW